MEYRIIFGIGTGDLQKQVNIHLAQGWTLQGGVSTDGKAFFQAMTKER